MKVTKDMTIGELLMADRGAGMILMQNGMHCVGCPSAAGETLEDRPHDFICKRTYWQTTAEIRRAECLSGSKIRDTNRDGAKICIILFVKREKFLKRVIF